MKQIIVTKCEKCDYVHHINYDEDTCYCKTNIDKTYSNLDTMVVVIE